MTNIRHFISIVESIETPAKVFIERLSTIHLPASIRVIPIDANTVELTDFLASSPGTGQGRATMKIILDLADELGITLECFPMYDEDVDDGLFQTDLENWYARLGFVYPVRDPKSLSDDSLYDDSLYMVRKPRS